MMRKDTYLLSTLSSISLYNGCAGRGKQVWGPETNVCKVGWEGWGKGTPVLVVFTYVRETWAPLTLWAQSLSLTL